MTDPDVISTTESGIHKKWDAEGIPLFFSLSPTAYRDLVAEVLALRALIARSSAETAMRHSATAVIRQWPEADRRFRRAVRQVLYLGRSWELSPEQYAAIVSHPCYRCLGPTGNGLGLLRRSSEFGYTIDNVRPCCGPCHNGWTSEESAR